MSVEPAVEVDPAFRDEVAATSALQNWTNARTCTDLTPAAGASEASIATETSPAPPAVVQQLSQDT